MNAEFFKALDLLEKEKGIPKEYMIEKVEAAQKQPRQEQSDGHQPGGIHVLPREEVLPHAAGHTPARRAAHGQAGAFYPIRHRCFRSSLC